MIEIVFAPPRTGKTCYLAYRANMAAFDYERNRAMQGELLAKRANGFDAIKTIPEHCVSANFDITMRKFGYRPRHSRIINPYRLGFSNPFVETHFNFPYEFIVITEGQKYLNSRMSAYFPDWQSRWYEQHGHNDLDIVIDTQRPMLIDVNIRELSQFVEILSLMPYYDEFGKPCRFKWETRRIPSSQAFDVYMASGKRDKGCYVEETVIADYNVWASYDSQSCKPKFYDGHFDKDIDYLAGKPTEESIEGYIKYLEENDDELPADFYRKRGVAA